MNGIGARAGLLDRLTVAAIAELLADVPDWVARCEREPPRILLTRCPVCQEWMPAGSREVGQCRACEVWLR